MTQQINKSLSQPNNRWVNQLINQSTEDFIKQPINQSISQSIKRKSANGRYELSNQSSNQSTEYQINEW